MIFDHSIPFKRFKDAVDSKTSPTEWMIYSRIRRQVSLLISVRRRGRRSTQSARPLDLSSRAHLLKTTYRISRQQVSKFKGTIQWLEPINRIMRLPETTTHYPKHWIVTKISEIFTQISLVRVLLGHKVTSLRIFQLHLTNPAPLNKITYSAEAKARPSFSTSTRNLTSKIEWSSSCSLRLAKSRTNNNRRKIWIQDWGTWMQITSRS